MNCVAVNQSEDNPQLWIMDVQTQDSTIPCIIQGRNPQFISIERTMLNRTEQTLYLKIEITFHKIQLIFLITSFSLIFKYYTIHTIQTSLRRDIQNRLGERSGKRYGGSFLFILFMDYADISLDIFPCSNPLSFNQCTPRSTTSFVHMRVISLISRNTPLRYVHQRS